MVCGLDLHRGQITFDALEVETGQVWRGRIWSPDRVRLRRWLEQEVAPRAKGGPVAMAMEGCTGWRYVVEEIMAAAQRSDRGLRTPHACRPVAWPGVYVATQPAWVETRPAPHGTSQVIRLVLRATPSDVWPHPP
jgi:hypothetical protein